MSETFTKFLEDFKDATEHAKNLRSGVTGRALDALNVEGIRRETGMSRERFRAMEAEGFPRPEQEFS